MLSTIQTAAICGLEAVPISVEVDVAKQSFPAFNVVGLPDKAIDEAKERVRSALRNSGAEFPQHRITVNLAPADLPKNGPAFDLPIAIGLLTASEQIEPHPQQAWMIGELSLDGSVRPVTGVLSIANLAKRSGATHLYVPEANAAEAATIQNLSVFGITSLKHLVQHISGTQKLQPYPPTLLNSNHQSIPDDVVDMQDILGQEQAKRAMEIAAAGGHNLLMQGLPGSGKTLLAKAFGSILPPLTLEETLAISTIYSITGLLGKEPLVKHRPFRSPHHTTSNI